MAETEEDYSREASDAQFVILSLSHNILLIKSAFDRPDLKDKEGWAPSVIHVPLSNAEKNCKPSIHQHIPEIFTLHSTSAWNSFAEWYSVLYNLPLFTATHNRNSIFSLAPKSDWWVLIYVLGNLKNSKPSINRGSSFIYPLVLCLLGRKSPSDICHCLSMSSISLDEVVSTLSGTMITLDTHNNGLKHGMTLDILGVAIETYRWGFCYPSECWCAG